MWGAESPPIVVEDDESDLVSYRAKAEPLADRDFTKVLARGFIRRTNDNLDEGSFTKKWDASGSKDTTDALLAQASVMAKVQSKYWRGVDEDDLRAWLYDSSKTLAHRWQDTYDAR